MSSIVGSYFCDKMTILSQFGVYSFLSYQNNFQVVDKSYQWVDLSSLLAQSIVRAKDNFMVYFCDKFPLVYQSNQIKTTSGQILLNNVQNAMYNNLTSELCETQSEFIVQQNNECFVFQLNYDDSYQIKVELTKTEIVKQPNCLTCSSQIEWQELFQKSVEIHQQSIQNTQVKIEQFWNSYTEIIHPGIFISSPIQLTFVLNEISQNSFKNIDNAVNYLKTISGQLVISIYNVICYQQPVFDFIYSNLYEVIIEIFNKSNFHMLQIIKVLFWQNRIDEAIELVIQSQSYQGYEEFLKYLYIEKEVRNQLSLVQYQQVISNYYKIFQSNLVDLDYQNIFLILFSYHILEYGTQQLSISFDPNIKLYIGKHTYNIVPIFDYATQLQVAILCSYNEHVDYFISQQNEVSKLGLTCFQIAIMGGNTEMIVKFQDQMKIQTFHITSLMFLMTTYTQNIPDQTLNKLIQLQAGMINQNKQCALQLYLQQKEPKQIPSHFINLLLEKEFKLLTFNSIVEFMTFMSFRQFQYLNEINFVEGLSVSEAVLYTIIQHNILYPTFEFLNPDMIRNTRFSQVCAKSLTHKHIILLFQHFSFSLSHDIAFLKQILLEQTTIKPIKDCLLNNLNILRGFSCNDFAINFKKIKFTNEFKKVDYFYKPIVAFDSFDGADIFSRNNQDYTKLFYLVNDLWQSE
ncbi:Hypothetical_protein [Hexamita inflata]|uniref:Hypothetical_protein n=1 Tax=Hexamita inflata TaxID=28002 RepID=A0AA86V016_9EUKA|nr:Hypothetical protein HINF_LOCUS58726 [Hexamita inflata]